MHFYRPMVSNADNFFSNLPALSSKEQKKQGNSGLYLSKEQRLQQKHASILNKQAKAAADLQKVEG